jgi:DNA-binding transcriptional ArsR family regulator
MVKYYEVQLDAVFQCLSDPIRRDILSRIIDCELSVGELVKQYDVSFPAISKHLKVLERAQLIRKRKEGRNYMVALAPEALKQADDYFEQYRLRWESRYNKLDSLLKDS